MIPLAPEVTAYGALLLLRWPEGLTSQIQATYLGVRPPWSKIACSEGAILDHIRLVGAVPASGDATARSVAFLFVQNPFNTKWEQATFFRFAPTKRSGGVADTHFVPGVRGFWMAGLAWYF